MDLITAAGNIINATSIRIKVDLTHSTACMFDQGMVLSQLSEYPVINDPGRPEKPVLVKSRHVSSRGLGSAVGRAGLIHALAHIEFNAINLAWDAIYRFREMNMDYYSDWIRIATEEAKHFSLLRGQLIGLGYDYGSFPAHDGLWDMAKKTSHDVLVRMAIIHRGLEARGLDVTLPLINRLKNHNQDTLIEILEKIYQDEIGHVATGTKWFNYLCDQRRINRLETFRKIILQVHPTLLKSNIDEDARTKAGFSFEELQLIKHGV